MDLETFEPIVKEESKWNLKGRNIFMSISKKDKEQEEWWPRITKEKVKNSQISIDWNRWVDPDDSGDEKKPDDQNFDPSMMQGMGGAGGMGGMGGGMPGMGGMGGMPGMGGPGGAGGMDMASMMAGMGGGGGGGMGDLASMMGGMGGAGGPGGMDPAAMQKMMEQMKMGGGMGGMGGPDSDDDEGEESQVDPHAKTGDNLDDLDGEETADLKK